MLLDCDQKFLKLAGVYTITNMINRMLYVGSTKYFRERLNEHTRLLRNGRHHSHRLQNSWTKYGEDSFIFHIIDVIDDKTLLLEHEQYWIDRLASSDRLLGFNISRNTSCMRLADLNKQRAKSYTVSSPSGEQFYAKNLADFCIEHDLDVRSMRKVARHIYEHYRLWRCWEYDETPIIIERAEDFVARQQYKCSVASAQNIRNHNNKATVLYSIKSPDGVIFETVNLRQFSKDHALDNSCMYDVANSKCETYKGWLVSKTPVETFSCS